MRTAFALKQQVVSPLPQPIRLPLQEQHLATGHNPILLRSKQDENQPPVKQSKRTAPIAGPTLLKHGVPTITTRHSQQSKVRLLTNGIAKFPVWGSLRNKAAGPNQLQGMPKAKLKCSNCNQRNVGNALKKCGFEDWCSYCDASLWATNPEPEIGVETQLLPTPTLGAQPTFVDHPELGVAGSEPTFELACHLASLARTTSLKVADQEAAHGSSTSSGSTGDSDGSLSGDFQDNTSPIFTLLETKTLIRFFPVTFPSTLL